MDLLLPERDEGIAVIAKLAGDACNINCYYCYEKRNPHSQRLVWLEPPTLRAFLTMAKGRPLRVILHGGEPLLIGQTRMAALLDVLSTYEGPLALAIQTNGTLLSHAWMDLFDRFFPDLDVAVSIDGPPAANAYRVDYRDQPTFDATKRGIEVAAARRAEIGIAVTVTSLLLGQEQELLDFVGSLPGVRSVRFSACLDYNVTTRTFPKANAPMLRVLNGDGQGAPGWSTTPAEYSTFMARAYDIWKREHFRSFFVEPLHSILLNLVSNSDATMTDWSAKKEPYVVALYPDGRITSSDEISTPNNVLGSVDPDRDLDSLLSLATNRDLADRMQTLLRDCASCSHEESCRGGSLADRLRLTNTSWESEYCDARRALIDHVRASLPAEPQPVGL